MNDRTDFDLIRAKAQLKGDDSMATGNYGTAFASVEHDVSPEEWQARKDLAACYRLVDLYGMGDLIYNHITVRIPGTEHLLINLYGLLYAEITASSLAKIDLEGNVIWKPETDYGINYAGYIIHSAIHAARPDVGCVIHTHTRAGMAVSAMTCGLLPVTQHAMRFHGHIGYHDYEGPATSEDEKQRLVANLGAHNALVLRSHGLVTCGRSIPEAFNLLYQLEQSCRAQVDLMGVGADRILTPPADVIDGTAKIFAPGSIRRYGLLEWPAMLRRVEAESRRSGYPHHAS